jgi:hypothetical protein
MVMAQTENRKRAFYASLPVAPLRIAKSAQYGKIRLLQFPILPQVLQENLNLLNTAA